MTTASPSRTVLDMITGAWRTQALHTAVRLGVPDRIAAGVGDPDAIAEQTGADPAAVRRLLRLLADLGVLERDGGAYRNTPVSELLLDRPGSLRDMCLLYGAEFYRAWEHAADVVSGGPGAPGFERAYGQPLITYLSKDEEAAARFQRAMQAGHFFFERLPEVVDFSGATVVDVAGGSGSLLAAVLDRCPDARGLLIDLDHMVPIAQTTLEEAIGAGRAEAIAGDVFESIPSGGDIYLLSRLLGDWDDAACVRLLENCRRAAPADGRILVLERVVGKGEDPELASLWDLHLLMMNGGGQRTLDQFRALAEAAGLRLERLVPLPMGNACIELRPADGGRTAP